MSNVESELKLRLIFPGQAEAILKWLLEKNLASGLPREELLETTYYDTLDYRLLKSGLSYRIRSSQNGLTATVKADGENDGGLHRRLEFNAALLSPTPDINPFRETAIGARLENALKNGELRPIFGTSFSRRILNLTTPDGSEVELALDCGQIISGNKSRPILELELELKTGSCRSLISFGAEVSCQFPLLIELDSKLEKALNLAGLTNYFPKTRQNPIVFDLKESAVSNMYRLLIRRIQIVIADQHTFLLSPDSPLALQKFRVNLRRLRTMLLFSKPLMHPGDYSKWKTSLKDLGAELGTAHDLDAMVENWQDMTGFSASTFKQTSPNIHSFSSLGLLLKDKRKINVLKLHENLSKGQATPIFLGLWAWLETEMGFLKEDGIGLEGFAQERCRHLLEKFIDFGDKLDVTSADIRLIHKLRILNKRIRYILHDLSPVLNGHTGVLIERLKYLQDNLGCIQDAGVSLFNIGRLEEQPSADSQLYYEKGAFTGWQLSEWRKAEKDFPGLWQKTKKTAREWLAEY